MSSNVLSDQASAPQLASRRATWLLSGFLLAHAILAWINRIPGISWGEDDAGYLFLARELRQLSYRELQDIALPMHARFPPLYPLIIAVVGWPFGDALNALLLMNTMFSMGAVVLLFLATRRKLGENIALIASGLFAVNPTAVWDSGHLMAESAFKFFVLLGIWALTREDDHVKFAVLAGAAAIAAALTRSAGVVLLPALFLYWLVNRRYRWATYLFVAGSLTVGVWLAWTFLAPEPEFRRLYVADLGLAGRRHSRLQLLQNTLLHLPDRTRHMITVVVPFVLALPVIGDTIVDNVLWMLVTVSAGVTGVILLARRWQIAAFVLVFYAALLFVWRYALERFASPLVPILLVALALGADWLTRRFTPRWRGALMGSLVALLAFGALRVNVLRAEKNLACDRGNPVDDSGCWDSYARAYLQAALWVRDSTPATALFFVNKERGFYMHAERKTINQDRALQEDSLSLAAYLRARGTAYAVAAQVGVRSDKHNVLLASACRDFVVLKQFPRLTAVLRLRNADDPPDDGRACRVLSPYRGRTRERE